MINASCEPQFDRGHRALRDPCELPDDILCSIIDRLDIREAVKATVVCRRWRKVAISSLLRYRELLFTSKTILGLNCMPSNFLDITYPTAAYQPYVPCGSHHGMKLNRFNKVKFVRAVNQFIDFYGKICTEGDGGFLVKKPNVSCFAVQFCLGSDFSSDIARWIEFATQFLRVHSFFLELQCDAAVFNRFKNKKKFVINSNNNCVYELFKPDVDLKNLRLTSCVFDANSFDNRPLFASLTELTLTNVPPDTYDDKIFGSLVNIETLSVNHCLLPEKFCLGSMPSLQSIYLKQCRIITELHTSNNLKLTQVTSDWTIELELEDAPNLESLTAWLDESGTHHLFNVALEKLPMLSALDVDIQADLFKCLPDWLPTHSGIKSLRMGLYVETRFDAVKMIHLVKALPSLCELELSLELWMALEEDSGQEQIETNDFRHIRHLEQVMIFTDRGTKNLFQFATYLLKHATFLQRLKLTKLFPWHEEELQSISALEEHSGDVELVVKR